MHHLLAFYVLLCLPYLTYGSYPSAFDVVTLAIKPSCVNRLTISGLNKYLVPTPRKIHVIASTGCETFLQFSSNVVCHQEESLVPNLTKAAVQSWLDIRFGRRPSNQRERVKQRGSWYFQQFLKLAASAYIPGLSDHFLLHDGDMIPLKPMTWFLPANGVATGATGGLSAPGKNWHDASRAVQWSAPGCVNPNLFVVLLQIGGWTPPAGYQQTYERLTGTLIRYAHDRSSFVSHAAVMYQPYMKEFLNNITHPRYKDIPLGWALSVLDAVALFKKVDYVMIGFSEYWSYASWVQERYPCTVVQAERREWTRGPALMSTVMAVAVMYKGSPLTVCCPTKESLKATAERGYLYTGYELSHMQQCHYNHGAFSKGYAEWYMAV